MGSGGSGWWGRSDPGELIKKVRDAEGQAASAAFDGKVEAEIGKALAEYNERDTEAIQTALDKIKGELGKEFELALDLRFGGSVSKNTFVNGLSDVDALVLLHQNDVTGKTPEDVRKIFAERLRARFGENVVTEGVLAVTLRLNGQEIQLLPAIKHGTGYKISSVDGRNWSSIRPRKFAELLTRANADMNGRLVPTIKLAKAIVATLPQPRQLSGYHTEVLAVSVFQSYTGPKTCKTMLRHFFEKLPEAVRQPRRDVTGQSIYLDKYLGQRDSPERRIVADAMDRIARKIRNADGAQSVAFWRDLLDGR